MDINLKQLIDKYLLDNNNFEQIFVLINQEIKENPDKHYNYWYLGLIHLLNGNESESDDLWMSVILNDLDNGDNLTQELITFLDNYAVFFISHNLINLAIIIHHKIQELNTYNLPLQLNHFLQQYLQKAFNYTNNYQFIEAKNIYEILLNFQQNNSLIWQKLALIYYELLDYQSAYQAIIKALNLDSENYLNFYYAGIFLEKLNYLQESIVYYQKVIKLNPHHSDSYNNLANIFSNHKQLEKAEELYKKAIEVDDNNYGIYINLGNLYLQQKRIQEALLVYQKALLINPNLDNFLWIVNNIRSFNYIKETINFAEKNCNLLPDNLLAKLESYRILPFVYKNESEIEYYRQRLTFYLEEISNHLTDPKMGLQLVNYHSNYHLQYQGQNDLQQQYLYGNFLHQVMKANYPDYCQLIISTSSKSREKIKVGYISYCLRSHVVGKLALGWIQHHDRNKLEIYSYYLGDFPQDKITDKFKEYSHQFYQLNDRIPIENIAKKIKDDELDILVFLDLGMYPRMSQLAGLRLAKNQCVTWFHPVTSGIPTIDYFISSDLIEKETANSHYSEKLIKLPKLGIVYTPQRLKIKESRKSKFNLSEDKIIYLTSQFPSKYLPQYDYIYPTIAHNIKNVQFVFIHSKVNNNNEIIVNDLWDRIKENFLHHQLNWEDYCLFLPTIANPEDYWELLSCCDIFLDTIGFTGFNSTLDALESSLPVVTLSGEYFRTRQSEAILKMISVTDTVAKNEEDYLHIAVELGINQKYRENIVNKIKQNIYLLYNDLTPVTALENFYSKIIKKIF